MWTNAATLASGLRVPKPYGDYLVLDILKQSGGLALAATDAEILTATRHWAQVEGIFAAPKAQPAWSPTKNFWPATSLVRKISWFSSTPDPD